MWTNKAKTTTSNRNSENNIRRPATGSQQALRYHYKFRTLLGSTNSLPHNCLSRLSGPLCAALLSLKVQHFRHQQPEPSKAPTSTATATMPTQIKPPTTLTLPAPQTPPPTPASQLRMSTWVVVELGTASGHGWLLQVPKMAFLPHGPPWAKPCHRFGRCCWCCERTWWLAQDEG